MSPVHYRCGDTWDGVYVTYGGEQDVWLGTRTEDGAYVAYIRNRMYDLGHVHS